MIFSPRQKYHTERILLTWTHLLSYCGGYAGGGGWGILTSVGMLGGGGGDELTPDHMVSSHHSVPWRQAYCNIELAIWFDLISCSSGILYKYIWAVSGRATWHMSTGGGGGGGVCGVCGVSFWTCWREISGDRVALFPEIIQPLSPQVVRTLYKYIYELSGCHMTYVYRFPAEWVMCSFSARSLGSARSPFTLY